MPKATFPAYLRREIAETLRTHWDPGAQQIGRLIEIIPEQPELSIDLPAHLLERAREVLAAHQPTAGIAKLYFGGSAS